MIFFGAYLLFKCPSIFSPSLPFLFQYICIFLTLSFSVFTIRITFAWDGSWSTHTDERFGLITNCTRNTFLIIQINFRKSMMFLNVRIENKENENTRIFPYAISCHTFTTEWALLRVFPYVISLQTITTEWASRIFS